MSTKLVWTQKTKYLWEANIKGWYLEVIHIIPKRPSINQYTFSIDSMFTKHQTGLYYATVEEAKEACEDVLKAMLKGLQKYAQEVLDELDTSKA